MAWRESQSCRVATSKSVSYSDGSCTSV